jgi:CRP/FNR family cyclic AMP-dependent transcriptional regulator
MERAGSRALPQDTLIVQNGYRSDSLYIILEGRVKILLSDSKGNETVIYHFGPGEYLGGMGFDGEPPSVSIMTVEPSQFLVLPKSDFKAFLLKNHLCAACVFEKLAREAEALQQKTAISEILRAISNSPTDVQSLLESMAENTQCLIQIENKVNLLKRPICPGNILVVENHRTNF